MTAGHLATQLCHATLVDPASGPLEISSVTNDSQKVETGSLYAALTGEHLDGHTFIDDAIRSGATAVLCSRLPNNRREGVAYFHTSAPRPALSEISDIVYGRPSEDLDVVGVTGTDGKSSTVYFLYQLLTAAGWHTSFLSTAGHAIGAAEQSNLFHQSTPEAPEVHRLLRAMADSGSRTAVLESTSHGLSAKTCRLAHVRYRAAIFTNLSHEHLEFHGTYEQYRDDKANLFRALDSGRMPPEALFHANGSRPESRTPDPANENRPILTSWPEAGIQGRFGIVNLGSPEASYFASATRCPVVGIAAGTTEGALSARNIAADATGSSFIMRASGRERDVRLTVPGVFNVENVLGAVAAAALLTGTGPLDLAGSVPQLRAVSGRTEIIQSEPFVVAVDYAHTPGSFSKVLPFFREHTQNRLIVVFGSAGERDRTKRPIQGRIADEFADTIVLTDEDPRGEEPLAILDEIAAGCSRRIEGEDLFKVTDRKEAIKHAIGLAQPGDTVLLLGKGHEVSIIYETGDIDWDEAAVAREMLSTYQ